MRDLSPKSGDLEPIETASQDELQALQLERLRWTLRHAYENVPQYRASFDAAGVAPDDCRELSDLTQFPFTTKQDLRENYPFGMFAVPREQIIRVHASSGTTGRPTVVGYTREDIDTWSAVMARSIRRPAGGRVTSCTSRTATACSPAGSARTTAPRHWAAQWCRCPAV